MPTNPYDPLIKESQASKAPTFATEEEALQYIWDNREDIRRQYKREWGENADPIAAVRDWLKNSNEAGTKGGAVAFAQKVWESQPAVAGGIAERQLQFDIYKANWEAAHAEALEATKNEQWAADYATRKADQLLNEQLTNATITGYDKNGKPTYARESGTAALSGYMPGGEPTLATRTQETDAALRYFEYINSLKGPQDWIPYWNATRPNVVSSLGLPAWATALATGTTMPSWQAPGGANASTPPAGQGASFNPANLPQLPGSKVRPDQYQNMNPSEQAGLQGMVESQGGWWPDWLNNMWNAAPKGGAVPRTIWGQ